MPAPSYRRYIRLFSSAANTRYYIAHLTLTVVENVPDINCDHLHRVLQFISQRLKRAASDFQYSVDKGRSY